MAFFLSLWVALREVLASPFRGYHLWWQLAPIFLLWLILEIYFDRHKSEELGWNTALGNSITLFWISISGMQQLFNHRPDESFLWSNAIMVGLIMCYALFVAYVSFGHKLGAHITYVLAYPTIIYYLSTFAVFWGYKALEVNRYILLVFVLSFLVVWGVRWIFFELLPEAREGA